MIAPTRCLLVCLLAASLPAYAADEPDIVIQRAPDPDESATQAEAERLAAEVADLHTKLQSAQATIEVLSTKNQQLDLTLNARIGELREVKALLATAEARLKELTAARGETITPAVLAAEKARADEATTRLNTLVAGASRLQDEKAELESELARVRERLAAATPAGELSSKISELESQLAETRRAEALVRAENDVLRATSNQHAQSAATLQTFRQENSRLQSELAQLRESEKTLRQQLADATSVKSSEPSPEIAAKLAELEDKLSTSLRSYTLLQQENDRLKNAAADTETLNAELASLRAENAELESKLAQPPPADLTAKLADTENRLDTTLRSYSQLQAENDRLKASAAEVTRLQAELDSLRADHATLESRLADATATQPAAALSEDLARRLASTEDRLATVLRSYSQLQDENHRLKNEAARSAESAHASAERSAADTASQMSALYDELRQTRAQLASVSAENAQLKTRLALSGPPPGSTLAAPTRPGFARPQNPDTPAPVTPAEPAAAPRQHTVVLGDTLAKISRQYYGTPGRWDQILEANRDVIQNENALTVGITLRIP